MMRTESSRLLPHNKSINAYMPTVLKRALLYDFPSTKSDPYLLGGEGGVAFPTHYPTYISLSTTLDGVFSLHVGTIRWSHRPKKYVSSGNGQRRKINRCVRIAAREGTKLRVSSSHGRQLTVRVAIRIPPKLPRANADAVEESIEQEEVHHRRRNTNPRKSPKRYHG